jgi:Family of unknown function (DUF6328)
MATPEQVVHGPDGDRQETYLERLDRNLDELVSELRVAQTGVQILFAFLLIVPFSNRFPSGNSFDQAVYVVTLLLTGASAGFLIAPSSHHRLLFRRNDKRYLVFTANQLMITGLGCPRHDRRRASRHARAPRHDGRGRDLRRRAALLRPAVVRPARASPAGPPARRVALGAALTESLALLVTVHGSCVVVGSFSPLRSRSLAPPCGPPHRLCP